MLWAMWWRSWKVLRDIFWGIAKWQSLAIENKWKHLGTMFSFFFLYKTLCKCGSEWFKIRFFMISVIYLSWVEGDIDCGCNCNLLFSFIALIKHNYPSRDFDKVWESCISSINQLVLDITNRRTTSYENDF